MCEALNWAVLPVAGGLYDQHPKLLEQWRHILVEKSKEEKRKDDERERKSKQTTAMPRGASRPRR